MEENTFTFGVSLLCSRIVWRFTTDLKIHLVTKWNLRTSRCCFQSCLWSRCRIRASHQICLSFSTWTGQNLYHFTNKPLCLIFDVFIEGSYNTSFGLHIYFCRPLWKQPDQWTKVPQKQKADQDSCGFTFKFSVECLLQAQTDTSLGGFMWSSVRNARGTAVTDSLFAKCWTHQIFLFGVTIFKTSGI
jgi:hypothetical protein